VYQNQFVNLAVNRQVYRVFEQMTTNSPNVWSRQGNRCP